jgi:hypothetical protein
MPSSTRTAGSIGVLYLATMAPAPFSLLYAPSHFIVLGDASATVHNIVTDELTYRLAILCGVWNIVLWCFLAMSLYALLEDVDRKQARLMVMFVSAAVAAGILDAVIMSTPLVIHQNASALSAFTQPQLDALAYALLRLRSFELAVVMAFWGLWLLPLGILIIRSGFIPKLIGALLIVGCVGWLIECVVALMLPQYRSAVFTWMQPLVAPGELSLIGWLLIKGGSIPLTDGGAAAVMREQIK